jgi:hypothetical protein
MPSPAELQSVEKCRAIAKQTIEDMSREWTRNQINGWHAVWFLYQACMIPLVSIFWENWNPGQVREWQRQIEMVIDLMEGMADWSLAARRSREVVCKMYEASKRPITRVGSPRLTPNGWINGSATNGTTGGLPNGITNENYNGNSNMNGINNDFHEMTAEQKETHHQGDMAMLMEEGMALMENQSIWDLDGMLWGHLDMPFDDISGMDFDFPRQDGYDGSYVMHQ